MLAQKEINALLKDYHSAKLAAGKAKAIGDAIKAEIIERGNITKAIPLEGAGFVAWTTTSPKATFDTKRFKADYPELYEQYLNHSMETRLYLK